MKGGLVAVMKFIERFRGKWLRRLAVSAVAAATLPGLIGFVGGSATAGAFSRPGLPVEYLDVFSAVDEPQHPGSVPGRRTARRLSARRPARAGRLQRLGHQHPGVRVVRPVRPVGRDAGGRPVQLLHRLVPAVAGQRPGLHLQVGDLPDPGTACVAGGQQGRVAERQRGGRHLDGGQHRADLRDLLPAEVHLRRVAVGLPEPVRGLVADADRAGDERRRRLQRREHVGSVVRPGVEAQRPDGQRRRSWSPTTPGSGSTAAPAPRRISTRVPTAAT